jgi:hypothetical protein
LAAALSLSSLSAHYQLGIHEHEQEQEPQGYMQEPQQDLTQEQQSDTNAIESSAEGMVVMDTSAVLMKHRTMFADGGVNRRTIAMQMVTPPIDSPSPPCHGKHTPSPPTQGNRRRQVRRISRKGQQVAKPQFQPQQRQSQ